MICLSQTFPQFNPGIIVVGFCFSVNSDVSWLLRRCGISATMFLTHDLRTITNNPLAELNEVQKQLLTEIGNFIRGGQINDFSRTGPPYLGTY